MWNEISNGISNIMNTHVPSKMSSTRFSLPLILKRRKQRYYNRARNSRTEHDWQKYKDCKRKMQSNCRKAYAEYMSSIVCADYQNGNRKKLWSYVKSLRRDCGVAPLKNDGVMYTENNAKANILNQQFSSVFTREDIQTMPVLPNSPYPDIMNITVNIQGVAKLLSDLNPNKACGPDNISPRLLKEIANEIAPSLALLFQASLQQNTIPASWKKALVTPIFKKGERYKPANYRPISLTSICSKILEHIVHHHIISYLETQGILSNAQHGFRKKRSCDTQLILTVQDLSKSLDCGDQVDAVLLDFSKAFDKVPHQRLRQKLHYYGVRGQTLDWVTSFLSNRSQSCVWGECICRGRCN